MPRKTVAVLGAAYGGARAAQLIAAGLPDDWRIILIDRNSHVNHVYILPRLAVLPGHEHKAFVPSDNIFNIAPEARTNTAKYIFIQAHVQSFSTKSVKLSRAFPELGIPTETLHFDYAIYALGSHLPSPLNLWAETSEGKPCGNTHAGLYGGTKAESIAWLKSKQADIATASSVLVVGGGALGIQFAMDIIAVHPEKHVTLLHSRMRLLPRFDSAMHTAILQALESENVNVILGERLDLFTAVPGRCTVRTTSGREICADLVLLCTGQRPNTELLSTLDARTVEPQTRLAHILRTMQLGVLPSSEPALQAAFAQEFAANPAPEPSSVAEDKAALAQIALQDQQAIDTPPSTPSIASSEYTNEDLEKEEIDETTPYPHIFVVGDAADAFGAIPAGHNAYYQAEVAAKNVLKLIRRDSGNEEEELERYTPGAPAIKVSLGLKKNVYQVNGIVGTGKETRDDLNASAIWPYFGCPVTDPDGEEMYR